MFECFLRFFVVQVWITTYCNSWSLLFHQSFLSKYSYEDLTTAIGLLCDSARCFEIISKGMLQTLIKLIHVTMLLMNTHNIWVALYFSQTQLFFHHKSSTSILSSEWSLNKVWPKLCKSFYKWPLPVTWFCLLCISE